MSVIIDDKHKTIGCPHCQGKFNVEVERSLPTVQIKEEKDFEAAIEKMIEKKLPKREEKEEKPKEVEVPSYLPKHFCNNPDGCEGHPNKGRKKVTKKCTDCDQVAPKKATKCAFCGNKDFEDLDDDDFEKYNKGMIEDHEHE